MTDRSRRDRSYLTQAARRRYGSGATIALCFIAGLASSAPAARAQDVALWRVSLDAHETRSDAIVVERGALVHTTQVFAEDAEGRVSGDLRAQTERVLDQLETVLAAAGSSLHWLVRLHVYVVDETSVAVVEDAIAQRRGTTVLPPLTAVQSAPVRDGALVAMDAIAATDVAATTRRLVVDGLPDRVRGGAHVAVQAAGPFVVVSGRAAQGDFAQGVAGTLDELAADLAGVGLSWDDVVQIKSFVRDVSMSSELRELVAGRFTAPAPPHVVTEWLDGGAPAEIELIAAGGRSAGTATDDAVTFVEPIASRFSRVAVVHGGQPVLVGGVYGGADDPVRQVDEVFARLARILELAGSDMRHLVKATYYVSDKDADARINAVRPGLYEAQRPPAASKISVRGAGRPGQGSTLDMLAVTTRP